MKIVDASLPPGAVNVSDDSDDGQDLEEAPQDPPIQKLEEAKNDEEPKNKIVVDIAPVICPTNKDSVSMINE